MNLQLQSLHLTFCNISGYSPKYEIYEQSWHDYVRKGFTESDLRCVLLFLKRENRRLHGTCAYSLRLGKFLDFQYHHFSDILSEARAKERNHRPRPTARDRVLSLYLKEADAETKPAPLLCRSVKDILKSIVNQPEDAANAS